MNTTRYTVHTPGNIEPAYATYCEDTAWGVARDEARALPEGSDVEVRDNGIRIGAYRTGLYPARMS